jgi:hypothetical protein
MKSIAGIVGIGAACLACCALPGLGSVIAWLGVVSIGSAGLLWLGGFVALVATAIAVAAFIVWRRRIAPALISSSKGCGCSPTAGVPDAQTLKS